MPVIGYLFWLALVSAWLDAASPCDRPKVGASHRHGAGNIVDLAQWRLSHPRPPANGNGPTRGRAA